MKKIAISVGQIPAKLDDDIFIIGKSTEIPAIETVELLATEAINTVNEPFDITIIAWSHTVSTNLLDCISKSASVKEIIPVQNVFEYHNWFITNAASYDAFIFAADVPNLTPAKPISHDVKTRCAQPDSELDIPFIITPRPIEAIRKLNQNAIIIGYRFSLTDSHETLLKTAADDLFRSSADVIFTANISHDEFQITAVMPGGLTIECSPKEHMDLIMSMLIREKYKTEIQSMTFPEITNPDVHEAIAIADMFEKTFPRETPGSVAVSVANIPSGGFVTTPCRHVGGPVLVRGVNHGDRKINASGKPIDNAAAMSALMKGCRNTIVVYRHNEDPVTDKLTDARENMSKKPILTLPGTTTEADYVRHIVKNHNASVITFPHHGCMKAISILPINLEKCYGKFPGEKLSIPDDIADIVAQFKDGETLEIGENPQSSAKYVCNDYVDCETAKNLTWGDVAARRFDLVYACVPLNYIPLEQIETVLACADAFAGVWHPITPSLKTRKNEVFVYDTRTDAIRHVLRLPDDRVMRREFKTLMPYHLKAYGLYARRWGTNLAVLTKGLA